jgi:hypothetical protein
MVDCGYCEPEKKNGEPKIKSPQSTIIQHSPIIINSDSQCNGPNCRVRQ